LSVVLARRGDRPVRSCPVRTVVALTVLAAALLATPPAGHAGSITMETTIKVEVGPTVKVTLTGRNKGNDTANDVAPSFRFDNAVRKGKLVDHLPPKGSQEWVVEFPVPEKKGRYPLLCTVSYTDPGFRGYSAVSASMVDVGGVFPARLRGSVSSIRLDSEGTLDVTIESAEPELHDYSVTAFLPDELGGIRDVGKVRASTKETGKLSIPITNHGALGGSRYPVYAIIRTTDGDHTTAAMLTGSIEVTSSTPWEWQSGLRWAAKILVAVWLLTEIGLRMRDRWWPAPGTPLPRT